MSEKPALEADVDNVDDTQHHSDGADGSRTKKARGQLDAAADYLREHAGMVQNVTDAEMRKVLWKIDLRLMPIMLVTITLAAVDASFLTIRLGLSQLTVSQKIVISNAALYGMRQDIGLVGQLYSWTGSIFYFGYLVRLVRPTSYDQNRFLIMCPANIRPMSSSRSFRSASSSVSAASSGPRL